MKRALASMRRRVLQGVLAGLALSLSIPAVDWAVPMRGRLPDRSTQEIRSEPAFRFSRLRYPSSGAEQEAYYFYDGRLWERWETDYPAADRNFVLRLEELTTVRRGVSPVVVDLDSDDLFDTPFLYLCDVGWMEITEDQARRLGDFLKRGGFLWADDFWGLAEWRNFESIMAQVLPETTWQPIPEGAPLLNMLFPLKELPQIPARDFARFMSHDPPEIHRQPALGIEQAELRGFHDDAGNLVAVASLNSDIGDGWEREAYGDWFLEKFSSVAYAFGVNTILYALSH